MRWIKSILIVTVIFGLFSQSGFAVTTAQSRVFLPFVSSEIYVPYWIVVGVGKPDSVGKEVVYGYYPKYEVRDIEGNLINTLTPPDGEVWLMPTFIPRSKKLVINVKRKTSVGEVWFTRYQDADSNNFYEVPVTGRDVPHGYVSATGQYFAVSNCVKSGGCYSIVFDASGQKVASFSGTSYNSYSFFSWAPDGYHAVSTTDWFNSTLMTQSFDIREPKKIYTTTMSFIGWSHSEKPIVLVDKKETYFDFYRASYDFASKQKLFTLSITPDDNEYSHSLLVDWNGYLDKMVFVECSSRRIGQIHLPEKPCEYGVVSSNQSVKRLGELPLGLDEYISKLSQDAQTKIFLSHAYAPQATLHQLNLSTKQLRLVANLDNIKLFLSMTPNNEYVLIDGFAPDPETGRSMDNLRSVRISDGKVFSLTNYQSNLLFDLNGVSWHDYYTSRYNLYSN